MGRRGLLSRPLRNPLICAHHSRLSWAFFRYSSRTAMCVILKYFILLTAHRALQQTIANASQIEDIEARIQSLGDVLASPVGEQDAEEKARREVLKKYVPEPQNHGYILTRLIFGRKLAGIMAGLEPLSERHGFMKFLNNANHADTLNGFVQDLAFAITDYQVCGTNFAEKRPNVFGRHHYSKVSMRASMRSEMTRGRSTRRRRKPMKQRGGPRRQPGGPRRQPGGSTIQPAGSMKRR